MNAEHPAHLNIADFFLDARVREGQGDRSALHHRFRTDELP